MLNMISEGAFFIGIFFGYGAKSRAYQLAVYGMACHAGVALKDGFSIAG